MKKFVIVYYSRKGNNYMDGTIINLPIGNTEIVAGKIQELTGSELYQIQTKHDYSADYHQCTVEAQKELKENARPQLITRKLYVKQYDVLFLGYPNWWGTMPMAVFSFLEAHDFSGTTIAPFCTHEGSGLGRSVDDIKKLCPGVHLKTRLAIQGRTVQSADEEIKKWLQCTHIELEGM